jgi:hypothetical protein
MPSPSLTTFKAFHDDLFSAYRVELSGQTHLVDKMKGYWLYFSKAFEDGEQLFKRIKKVNSVQQYELIVKTVWEQYRPKFSARRKPKVPSEAGMGKQQ